MKKPTALPFLSSLAITIGNGLTLDSLLTTAAATASNQISKGNTLSQKAKRKRNRQMIGRGRSKSL